MVNATSAPAAQAAVETDVLSTTAAGPAAVRGGAMRIVSFLGGSLFSVGAAALLFRHLGVVETGRYTTAMSLGALVMGLTDLGLTAIGMRELTVLDGQRRASLARNLLGMRLALAAAGVLVVTSLAFAAYGRLLGFGVLVVGVGVLVQTTQTTLSVSLMARLRLGWLSMLEFARQLLAAGTIALFVLAGWHLLAFLAVTAIAASILLPFTAALVRGDIPIRPSFDTRQWRALVGPVLAYSAAVVTATLYLRVAIVLVSLIADSHQLGYYSVSYRVVESLLAIPGLLVGAAFPIFAYSAQHDPVRLGYALARVFEVSLIVGVWISLALVVGSRLAIEVVGGPSFQPAAPVVAVQGLAVAAAFVSTVWACALLSLRLHRVILFFNLALLALVAVAVAVLGSMYGAQGAAAATSTVEIVAAVVGALVLVHGRPHLRPSLRVVPKVAVAAALGGAPMLLGNVPTVGRLALSTCLYTGALLLLGGFPSDLPELFAVRGRS
jgi:O-antigen/teichoic acid export membrane protein